MPDWLMLTYLHKEMFSLKLVKTFEFTLFLLLHKKRCLRRVAPDNRMRDTYIWTPSTAMITLNTVTTVGNSPAV
jgi:hypothetical protein